jgi:type IV pilus assembly protein PilA
MNFSKFTFQKEKGFTLIELLLVIGILATLLAITLIAINPARQFQAANNTRRRSDVITILNAINQYQVEHSGTFTPTIPTTTTVIGNGTGQLDICSALVTTYVAALPVDPLTNNGTAATCTGLYNTNYTASMSATNSRIIISAPATEGGIPVISVTR